MTPTDLKQRIAKAKVELAKSAIASPEVYPQWDRLRAAKINLARAYTELTDAQREWDAIIEAAPPEWKALAPSAE